jgi:hypothetical protein
MRTLTRRELNRALLTRRLLLERGRMPIVKALERVGGLLYPFGRLGAADRRALNEEADRLAALHV